MAHIWYFQCFLILKSGEYLTDNIMSHEAIGPYLKNFTFTIR